MIRHYYERICHLRWANSILNEINALQQLLYYYNRGQAIMLLSRLTVKYEAELQSIAMLYSGRPIVRGSLEPLYNQCSDDDIFNDIYYLIDCLIVIGAVKYRVVPSLEHALNELANEQAI